MSVFIFWLLRSSVGRIGMSAVAICGTLFGVVAWAEHKGAERQLVRQVRVDTQAKQRADKARAAVAKVKRDGAKRSQGAPDGFARD